MKRRDFLSHYAGALAVTATLGTALSETLISAAQDAPSAGSVPTNQKTGRISEQRSRKIAADRPTPGSVHLLPDVPLAFNGTTETKQWTWGEWFIPPIGSGRTIIDFRWSTVLTLARTTDASGKKLLYLNINVNPGILAWNIFETGKEPHVHATLPDVGIDVDFGTFSGGCGGVMTYFNKTNGINVDIFDKAKTAQLLVTEYSFVYCQQL